MCVCVCVCVCEHVYMHALWKIGMQKEEECMIRWCILKRGQTLNLICRQAEEKPQCYKNDKYSAETWFSNIQCDMEIVFLEGKQLPFKNKKLRPEASCLSEGSYESHTVRKRFKKVGNHSTGFSGHLQLLMQQFQHV